MEQQKDYHASILVNTNPKEALDGINDVAAWWGDDLEGATQKEGDTFKIRFGKTFVDFKISEAVPEKKIVWHAEDSFLQGLKDAEEWTGTSVKWEVSPEGNQTRIDMTHIGLQPEVECYAMCEKGWNFYVKESLAKLLNEGKGMPDGRPR